MASIKQSVRAYESWMRKELGREMVEKDLTRKHEKMAESPFVFLRGTFWRWAETILEVCPDLAQAPTTLAVGDIHLENFGTWRDEDGRLVWGVNDFDEAAEMPFAIDLVRLATSALLAKPDRAMPTREICGAILAGYRQGLEEPKAIVLDRDWAWLRELVVVSDKARARFWKQDRTGRVQARAPALRRGACLRHARAQSADTHRTPDRGHRQPRTTALDRRHRLAWHAGRARGQGRSWHRPGRLECGAPGRSRPCATMRPPEGNSAPTIPGIG